MLIHRRMASALFVKLRHSKLPKAHRADTLKMRNKVCRSYAAKGLVGVSPSLQIVSVLLPLFRF